MLRIVAKFFSFIRIRYLNAYVLEVNPMPASTWMPNGYNPNINANYISTIVNVSITDIIRNQTFSKFGSTYLPMKESGLGDNQEN
jgi:hypothetical protein